MTRFRFRLDRVLDLRRRDEEARARELAFARHAEAARAREHERASEERARANAQFGDAQSSGLTAGSLANLDLTRTAAEGVLDGCEQRLSEARALTQAERERFGDARRDRRRVEKLRERKQAAWQVETARDERRTLDDIAGRCPLPRREP